MVRQNSNSYSGYSTGENDQDQEAYNSFNNQDQGTLAWTCPSNTQYFPLIFGNDLSCNINVYPFGFDVDSTGYIAHAGYFTAATSTLCPTLTNSLTGTRGYINFMDPNASTAGWYFLEPAIGLTSVVTLMTNGIYGDAIRLVEFARSTGAILTENNLDIFAPSDQIFDLQLQIDRADGSYYLSFSAFTAFYDGISRGYLAKFDSSLNQVFFIRKYQSAGQPTSIMRIIDLFISSTFLMSLEGTQTPDGNARYVAAITSKTTGLNSGNTGFYNLTSLTPSRDGVIAVNDAETTWIAIVRNDASNSIVLYTGSTTTFAISTAYQYTTGTITNTRTFSLEIDSAGYAIVTYVYNLYNTCVQRVNTATGSIVSQQCTSRGPNPPVTTQLVYSKRTGSNFYIMYSVEKYLTTSYLSRIVFLKVDIYGSLIGSQNCGASPSTSTFTLASLTPNYISSGTSYSQQIILSPMPTWSPVSPSNIVAATAPITDFYSMQDIKTNTKCALPISLTPDSYDYYLATDGGLSVTFPYPSATMCNGRQFTVTNAVAYNPAGTTWPSKFQLNSGPQTISVLIQNANTDPRDYVGTNDIRLTLSVDGIFIHTYVRIRIHPDPVLMSDPTSPNHTLSQCADKTYPWLFGHDAKVAVQHGVIDDYGNYIMAGYALKIPFGIQTGTPANGFLAAYDQRANPIFVYRINDLVTANTISEICYYVSQYQTSMFGMCNGYHQYLTSYTTVPFVVKISYTTQLVEWVRYMPLDYYDPNNQLAIFVAGMANNKVIASFKYKTASYQSFAVIKFDETTFQPDWYKVNHFQNVGFNGIGLLDEAYGYYYAFKFTANVGVAIQKVRLTDGYFEVSATIDNTAGVNMNKNYPAFYSNDKILLAMTFPLNYYCYLFSLYKSTLIRHQRLQIVYTSHILSIASVVSDSSDNVYLTIGDQSLTFFKFSPTFTALSIKTLRGYTTGEFYIAYSRGLSIYNNELFHSFSGIYVNGQQDASMLFKSDLNLDFSVNGCFSISDSVAADGTYYINSANFLNMSLNTVVTNNPAGTVDGIKAADNLPILADANIFDIRTYSFSTSWAERGETGYYPYTTRKRNFPYQNDYCSMVARDLQFQDPSIYEFTLGSGNKTIPLTYLGLQNCQGRPVNITVYNPNTNTNAFRYAWITYDNINTITINTNTPSKPISFHLKVRYYDMVYNLPADYAYYDHTILVRLTASTNLTLYTSDLTKCYMSTPFPLAFGGGGGSQDFPNRYVFVNPADDNLVISVCGTSSSLLAVDDGHDAGVFRVSEAGLIHWTTTIFTATGNYENAGATTLIGDYLYVYFWNDLLTTNTILKLSYKEGKLMWSRSINYYNLHETSAIQYYGGYEMMADPVNTGQFMFSHIQKTNTGYLPTFTVLKDDNIDLKVVFDYQIKPIASTSTVQTIGGIVYDYLSSYVYFAAQTSYVYGNTQYDQVLIKVDSLTGALAWSRIYTSTYAYQNAYNNVPALAQNNYTGSLYMAAVPHPYVLIMKITTGGTILQRNLIYGCYNYPHHVGLVMNHANGNVIIPGIAIGYELCLIYLDKDLNKLFTSQNVHYYARGDQSKFWGQSSTFFYLVYNINRFYYNADVAEVVIHKQPFDILQTGKYECHEWNENTGYPSNYTTLPLTNNAIPAGVLFQHTGLVTLENTLIMAYQLQKYGTMIYPNGDNVYGDTQQKGGKACSLTGISPLTTSTLPTLEVLMGQTASLTLTSAMFTQCQGLAVTYVIYDEMGSTTRNANNTYITISGSTITVDGTSSLAKPGFRFLQVTATVTQSGRAVDIQLPVIIWPAVKPAASMTAPTADCPGVTWPKSIGNYGYEVTSWGQSDMDETNGNIVLTTRNWDPNLHPTHYYKWGYTTASIILSDFQGKIFWAYTITDIGTPDHIYTYSATFGNNDGYIYTLTYSPAYQKLILMKQSYSDGKPSWMVQFMGTNADSGRQMKILNDPYDKYIYVTGDRSDLGDMQGFIMKVDPTQDPPVQEWVSYYAFNFGNGYYYTIYDISFSPFTDHLYYIDRDYFSGHGSESVGIRKHDKTTGKPIKARSTEQISSGWNIFQGMVQDPATGYIYLTYTHWYTSYTHYTHLNQFNENLDKVNGVYFSHPTQPNTQHTDADLVVDSDFVYSCQTNYDSWIWVVRYNKTYLNVDRVTRGNAPSATNQLSTIFTFGDYLYVFVLGTYYSQGGVWTPVFHQVHKDLSSPNNCVPFTLQSFSWWYSPNTTVDNSGGITWYNYRTYAKLLPFFRIYGELISSTRTVVYTYAENQGCTGSPPQFADSYVNQVITLPISAPVVYSFPWATHCQGFTLTTSWSVDKFTTIPSFLTSTYNSTFVTVNMNPTAADIGTYTVRVRFSLFDDATLYAEQTFLVQVYPATPYGQTITPSTCGSSIYPMRLYKNTDIIWHSGDVDSTTTRFMVCGRTYAINSLVTTRWKGFFQIYSMNWVHQYWLTFETGLSSSLTKFCTFGESDNIYTGTEAISTTATGNTDTALLMKHTTSGKMINAKQVQHLNNDLWLQYYYVDESTGDQYLSFRTSSPYLRYSSYQSIFFMRLDKDYNQIFWNNFNFATNSGSEGLNFMLDKTNNAIFQAFQFNNPNGYLELGIHRFYMNNGTSQWATGLSWSTNFQRHSTATEHVGLVVNSGFVYSMFDFYAYGPTTSGHEVSLSKHTTSGVLNSRIEFIPYSAPYHTGLFYHTAQNRLIGIVGYQQYAFIYGFNPTSPMTLIQQVKVYNGNAFNMYRSRMILRSGYLYFFIAGQGYSNGAERQIYIPRSIDFTTMSWDIPCASLQWNDNTAGTLTNLQISNNGINGDQSLYWGAITVNQVAINQTIIDKVFNNPTQLRIVVENTTASDYKYGTSACPVYSSPTPSIVNNRIGTAGSGTGGFTVSSINYTLSVLPFTQCQGITFSTLSYLSPTTALPSFIKFNNNSLTPIFYIFPTLNTQVGTYKIRFYAEFTSPAPATVISNYTEFDVEILKNEPPTLVQDFNTTVTMFAWHNYTCTIFLDGDLESDLATINAQIWTSANVLISPSPTWLIIEISDSSMIKFNIVQPPQPSAGTNSTLYWINVTIWDEWNIPTPRFYPISLTVNRNFAPSMTQTLDQVIPSFYLPGSFSKTLWYQNFTDAEGDEVVIMCNTNVTTLTIGSNWCIESNDPVSGNITLYGTTPRNNAYAGDYILQCTVLDFYDGTPNVYNFTFSVFKKQLVVLSNPGFQTFRLPHNLTMDLTPYFVDPQLEPITRTLYVNNTLYAAQFDTWFIFDDINNLIKVFPYNNTQGGNHSIALKLDDSINPPQFINFTIEVVYNWPLIALTDLPKINVITYNFFFFHYNKTELFMNPEGEPYTMYFRQAGYNTLPYFINKNFTNGTIGGNTVDPDIGLYDLECVGVDDAYWETIIPFQLVVKPCYYKCARCWDSDYNTCETCKIGFFLYGTECVDICIDGTFANANTLVCQVCPNACSACSGDDQYTQCQKCKPGFFKLNSGCYSQCPNGYWNDISDYTCKVCHPSCTECYGPSSSQCRACANLIVTNELGVLSKKGYLLAGTECKIPKCIDGQYFEWSPVLVNGQPTGSCLNCHSRCRKCVSNNLDDCVMCYPGYKYQANFTCLKCDEIPGYFTNEEFECEDKCGDGIIIDKECDDGNSVSGDGCSSKCQIEFGFACPSPGILCKENIQPDFKSLTVTDINLIYVEFTEYVNLTSESSISPDNMEVSIEGPSGTYVFSYRIINQDALVPERPIKKFQIILSDFKQSLTGEEVVKIKFKDPSLIIDQAGNPFTEGSAGETHPYPYTYVSAGESSAVASGGSSLKYTFLSVFSFNIALKLVMNSSMQYLWGLVHALQVFNFLLFLNIDFPDNISSFSAYLAIASGDLDELNQFIPSMSSYLVDMDNVRDPYDSDFLSPKFKEKEVPPYFIEAFGQKLTIWTIGFLGILPVALILNKICKKVKFWEEIISGFFFNGPLRTFVEMYIELVLQAILNTQFVKFGNISQILVTSFAFVFGAISLLLPFMTMTLIYHNRRELRRSAWQKKFGMLTEELRHRSILQLYFYPLFMYQRLMISGIIVYLYTYPLIQCLLVILCNVCMIMYMIVVRPFKEESQQTTTVIDEFVIMFTVVLFIVLLVNDFNPEERKNIGWAIIVLILLSVIKNFGVVIYFGFHKARDRLRKMFSAEDEQKDSPNTSDNSSDSVDSVNTDEALDKLRQDGILDEWNQEVNAKHQRRLSQLSQNDGPSPLNPTNYPHRPTESSVNSNLLQIPHFHFSGQLKTIKEENTYKS